MIKALNWGIKIGWNCHQSRGATKVIYSSGHISLHLHLTSLWIKGSNQRINGEIGLFNTISGHSRLHHAPPPSAVWFPARKTTADSSGLLLLLPSVVYLAASLCLSSSRSPAATTEGGGAASPVESPSFLFLSFPLFLFSCFEWATPTRKIVCSLFHLIFGVKFWFIPNLLIQFCNIDSIL